MRILTSPCPPAMPGRPPPAPNSGVMSTPTLEQVNAALATVNDPEIKRPITDLGMVDSVVIDEAVTSPSPCC